MKKFISAMLIAALITVYVPITASAADFTDVPPEHWAYAVINAMSDAGILSGFPDGTFRPSDSVTRAQWAKIMVLAANLEIDDSAPSTHDDIPFSHWARPYIETAKSYLTSLEIDGETVYLPDQDVTRVDACAAVVRLLGLADSEPDYSLIEPFNDYDTITALDESAVAFIAIAVENGLLKGGSNGYFRPSDVLSRTEAAIVIDRTVSHLENDTNPDTDPDTDTDTEPPVIELETLSAELAEGETLQLNAKIVPEDPEAPELIYTSEDTEIALVDSAGLITAAAQGNTVITVSTADGKLKAEFSLTVTKKAVEEEKSLWLDYTTLALTEGKSVVLKANVKGMDMPELKWESDNSDIAYVSSAGKVVAISVGEAVITVTTADGLFSAQCSVTVVPDASAPSDVFELTAENTDVYVGDQITLRWTIPQSIKHHGITLYVSLDGGPLLRILFIPFHEREFSPTVTFEGTFSYIAEITTENGSSIRSNILTVTVHQKPPVQHKFNIEMDSQFTLEDGISWKFDAIPGAVSHSAEIYRANTDTPVATMITTPSPVTNRLNGFPAGDYALYITALFADDTSATSMPVYFTISG